jgi:hypothetical protein
MRHRIEAAASRGPFAMSRAKSRASGDTAVRTGVKQFWIAEL